MKDPIERQAAVEALGDIHPLDYNLQAVLEKIKALPSAVKHGHWIENGYGNGEIVCSNCGEPCATFSMLKPRDRFCKWCGARMEGEENETD